MTERRATVEEQLQRKDAAIHALGEQLQAADFTIKALIRQKVDAYTERNYLVAVLSKFYPAHIMQHTPDNDPTWDQEWRNVICVHISGKRCGWHIHDSELPMFEHLKASPIPQHDYDGMTTPQKYGALSELPVTWTYA